MKQLELISRISRTTSGTKCKFTTLLCARHQIFAAEMTRSVLAISLTRSMLLLQLIPVSLRQIPKTNREVPRAYLIANFHKKLRRNGAIGRLNLESHLH